MGQAGPRVLDGRYRLEGLIASGGMGQVWRARDTLLGRPVAVKVLRSEYTADPSFLARFRAEAVHAASLSHPNVAAVYDYGEVDDEDGEHLAYLVMELVDGEPLSARLRRGALGTEATLSVLRQTAAALAEAHHAGLVHRDVKPGNILVGPDGWVKITDFGIAWSAGSVPITQAGQVLGTPQYVAPEQVAGQPPSPASDVYSLGLVGYECLTGHAAYQGDNPLTIALKHVQEQPEPLPPELPPDVRHLVDVAVARDPRQRPPDADAFVAAIDRVRQGRPPAEDPPTLDVRRPPVAPRRWVPAAIAAAVAVAVALSVAVLLVGRPPDPGLGTGTAAAVADRSPTVAPIVLHLEDHLGRPARDVARELSALGLLVQQRREVVPGAVPGTVVRLEPVGEELTPGDLVHLTVAVAAPSAPAPEPEPADDPATAAVDRAEPTSAEADVPSSTPEAAPSTAPEPPESSVSESAPPESSAPESSAPDSSAPDSSAPDSSAPATDPSTGSESGTATSSGSTGTSDSSPPTDSEEPSSSSAPSSSDTGGAPPDGSEPSETAGDG